MYYIYTTALYYIYTTALYYIYTPALYYIYTTALYNICTTALYYIYTTALHLHHCVTSTVYTTAVYYTAPHLYLVSWPAEANQQSVGTKPGGNSEEGSRTGESTRIAV